MIKQAAEIRKQLGTEDAFTMKGKHGTSVTFKGSANTPEEKAMKYTQGLARSLFSTFDTMPPDQRLAILDSLYDKVALKFGVGPLAPQEGASAPAAGSPQVSAARGAMISNIPAANRGTAIGGTPLAAGTGMVNSPTGINLNPMVGAASASTGRRIRVMNRQGQTGTILEEEFDPNLYQRI